MKNTSRISEWLKYAAIALFVAGFITVVAMQIPALEGIQRALQWIAGALLTGGAITGIASALTRGAGK